MPTATQKTYDQHLIERNARFVNTWPCGTHVVCPGLHGIIQDYQPDENGYLRAIVTDGRMVCAVPECQLSYDAEFYGMVNKAEVFQDINNLLKLNNVDVMHGYLDGWKRRLI
jgi:hypothetical protein